VKGSRACSSLTGTLDSSFRQPRPIIYIIIVSELPGGGVVLLHGTEPAKRQQRCSAPRFQAPHLTRFQVHGASLRTETHPNRDTLRTPFRHSLDIPEPLQHLVALTCLPGYPYPAGTRAPFNFQKVKISGSPWFQLKCWQGATPCDMPIQPDLDIRRQEILAEGLQGRSRDPWICWVLASTNNLTCRHTNLLDHATSFRPISPPYLLRAPSFSFELRHSTLSPVLDFASRRKSNLGNRRRPSDKLRGCSPLAAFPYPKLMVRGIIYVVLLAPITAFS
jgi:hypothetical protein